jgi:hypothetical protein
VPGPLGCSGWCCGAAWLTSRSLPPTDAKRCMNMRSGNALYSRMSGASAPRLTYRLPRPRWQATPAGACSAPDRPVLRASVDEHRGPRGRAEGGYRVPPTRRAVTVGDEAPPAGLASKVLPTIRLSVGQQAMDGAWRSRVRAIQAPFPAADITQPLWLGRRRGWPARRRCRRERQAGGSGSRGARRPPSRRIRLGCATGASARPPGSRLVRRPGRPRRRPRPGPGR